MATAKIWHYQASTGEEKLSKTNGLQLEPYLSRQQVTTSGIAQTSVVSPAGAHLARIEVTAATRYRVIPVGGSGDADANDPPLQIGGNAWNWIPCPPGTTISLIEAA